MSRPRRNPGRLDPYRPQAQERGLAPQGAGRPGPGQAIAGSLNVWAPHDGVGAAWTIRGTSWNVLLSPAFPNLSTLHRQLSSLRRPGAWPWSPSLRLDGAVNRLGIVAHGAGHGAIDMGPIIDATTLSRPAIKPRLSAIGLDFLRPAGTVIFFSCTAGATSAGTELLKNLSLLWRGRIVIGFTTFGFVSSAGASMTAAGNITDTLTAAGVRSAPRGYPRMSTTGPSAKHARNGAIIRWPQPAAMWRAYLRHNPSGAADVRRRAAARGTHEVFEYAVRTGGLDLANPHLSALAPTAGSTVPGAGTPTPAPPRTRPPTPSP